MGSKQNASACAGLEEGGSHTDSGAGWARASNGLIVLSQSCLQKFVGQVVPSDYPNNLKEEEKRKKDTSQYHRCATETCMVELLFFPTHEKEGTCKLFLSNAELE